MAAWEASFKKTTILKAFEATGLSPFKPEAILKRSHLKATEQASSDSESSTLIKDRGDPRAQKLSQAFHLISVQKSLLAQEAKGLKEALINERLRRKQGKSLPLKAPEEYHGGAVFWSPRKVKEARDRLQQQEAEEEQQQLQKQRQQRLVRRGGRSRPRIFRPGVRPRWRPGY
ncbi:hypothetical protein CC86DRAFT_344886 [Ophiobolus disseminans]|uniref:Uncharacterized protein n=1 Tax=Ophiobolus disseminans TaxID=1469910 RepID=A0A6A7ABH0_9PLEO|nr:hypothetical protein CC86DRAFT_344886 [Ophiobolus disseminans]